MSQCVPSWGLDDNPDPRKTTMRAHSNSISTAPGVPTLDYEVTELTWENGQLAMHGLGPPRVPNKSQGALSVSKYTWEKPRAGETLEAIVNQATLLPHRKLLLGGGSEELVPWLDHHGTSSARVSGSISASATMTMDALVPSSHTDDPSTIRPLHCSGSTRVGSCSANPALDERRVARVTHEYSRDSGSATFGMGSSQQMTIDTCEKELGTRGFTSTSIGSLGNTSSGKQCTKSTTPDDHDSVCHSRSQADEVVEGKKKGKGKSSLSTKRSRAAAIHNQSERKRRDRINQRMKTLQKMVPNSSKTDKASMLDEVIEYLKQLQAQVHMMSRMSMSPMMLPLAMQQQLQMSMMNPMNMGMGMGMGMGVMDLNTIGRSNMTPILHPSAFMPLATWEGPNNAERFQTTHPLSLMPDPLSAFLACQSQPMTMEAYTRMAALFQQMHQQPPGPGPKN